MAQNINFCMPLLLIPRDRSAEAMEFYSAAFLDGGIPPAERGGCSSISKEIEIGKTTISIKEMAAPGDIGKTAFWIESNNPDDIIRRATAAGARIIELNGTCTIMDPFGFIWYVAEPGELFTEKKHSS